MNRLNFGLNQPVKEEQKSTEPQENKENNLVSKKTQSSFKSQFLSKSNQKVYQEEEEAEVSKSNLHFLNKGNEEERLSLQKINPIKIQGKKEREKISLISFINCYKFLSPIVRKIAEENVSNDYIASHVSEANKFALTIADKLKVNIVNNKWFINCLERIYTETYVDIDKKSITEVENEIDYDSLIEMIYSTIENSMFFIDDMPEISDVNLKIEVSFLNNFNKMLTVYNKFNFYTKKEEFLKDFAFWLRTFSEKKFNQKIGNQSLINQKDRAIFYQSLLKEITINFIEIWKSEANQFVKLSQSDDGFLEEWKKNHPKGVYYKELFNKAEKQINDLFNLTRLVIKDIQ